MHIVRVIPIIRSTFAEELTYFSKEAWPAGTLVEVTIRNKAIRGLVIDSTPVADAKTAIRQADFQLKKISASSDTSSLPTAFITTIIQTASYYVTSPGRVLFETMPQTIRSLDTLPRVKDTITTNTKPVLPTILQARAPLRIQEYISAIRHAFSKHGSVLLLAPTIQDAEQLYQALGTGIQEFSYLFHSGVSKKKIEERWQTALDSRHAIVAVMTPGFISLPRHDIHTIIIDREAARAYKQHTGARIDWRNVALWYSKHLQAHCLLADEPLRIESMYAYQQGQFEAQRDIPTRIHSLPTTHLIDMRKEDEPPQNSGLKRGFHVISKIALEEIKTTCEAGKNVFLYTSRRGIAPMTVCQDCGTRVSCTACGAAVILHKGSPEHLFVCHACGAMRSANETCATCTSWRLISLGIGTQLIEREIRHALKDVPVFVLDRDTATTAKQARTMSKDFYSTKGSILLGTEMALGYLDQPIGTTIVISLDSLFSMPEWNIYERVYSLLTRIQEVTHGTCIIQTRKPHEEVLEYVLHGRIGALYQQELGDRKELGYPPYATLIKITITGSAREVDTITEEITPLLTPFGFTTLPNSFQTNNKDFERHGFIRLLHTQPTNRRRRRGEKPEVITKPWPDPELNAILRTLPQAVSIEIDPFTIL